MDYEVTFIGEISGRPDPLPHAPGGAGDEPVPLLKGDLAYGAHNQRSHVTVSAETRDFVWIEELVELIEAQGSCELYGLLKRPDEKYVTERAYDNPKFVEGPGARRRGGSQQRCRVTGYVVEAENFESIHNHSAYALIERDKAPT